MLSLTYQQLECATNTVELPCNTTYHSIYHKWYEKCRSPIRLWTQKRHPKPHDELRGVFCEYFVEKLLWYKGAQLYHHMPLKSLNCTEACVINTMAEPAGQVSDREILSAKAILSDSHKGISRGDGVHKHMTTGFKHGCESFLEGSDELSIQCFMLHMIWYRNTAMWSIEFI